MSAFETTVPYRKLNEECGVVGVYHPSGAAQRVHRALFALQHRGQEAAGIVTWSEEGELHHQKGRGLVADCLPTYRVKDMPGQVGIGHCRYSTVSVDRSENIQPFLTGTPYGRFAIAHNGNLKNDADLRSELEGTGSLLSTSMDTELMVHLIARSGRPEFRDALAFMGSEALGAFSLTMLCDGKLYGLRDPHGLRPLVLGELDDGGWVLASETCALEVVDARYVREIEPGELVEIGPEGVRSSQLLKPARPAPCVFELVYFARPNSTAFGQSVYRARTRMGEELAKADAARDQLPDIVVPIPDSGVPAAIGYARESGAPFEQAILRSHYVGRTFILPNQDSRTNSIQLKLSVIPEAVRGKRVLLVDDSIVRGNTSRRIVQMVREAGAAEVWMRVASPPLAHPCYLGIDTPSKEELVINREGSVEGVEKAIGVDDLAYLTLDGLRAATQEQDFCFGCMNGDYPV